MNMLRRATKVGAAVCGSSSLLIVGGRSSEPSWSDPEKKDQEASGGGGTLSRFLQRREKNGRVEVPPYHVDRKCENCGKPTHALCANCLTPYCSQSCQKGDWTRHKAFCRDLSLDYEVRMEKLISTPRPSLHHHHGGEETAQRFAHDLLHHNHDHTHLKRRGSPGVESQTRAVLTSVTTHLPAITTQDDAVVFLCGVTIGREVAFVLVSCDDGETWTPAKLQGGWWHTTVMAREILGKAKDIHRVQFQVRAVNQEGGHVDLEDARLWDLRGLSRKPSTDLAPLKAHDEALHPVGHREKA